jgi:hypothetical protein
MSLASYQAAPPRVPEGRQYGWVVHRAQEVLFGRRRGINLGFDQPHRNQSLEPV